ncbi:MAG: RluA family pseudouridine synthase [Thomasclavelia sp.]|nr:RluA family pseudouridine synthase [Thomasclavelia sp.]
MKEIIISENDSNQRIDKFLKKLLVNASNSFIYKMLRKKDIKINGKKVDAKYIVQPGDKLSMFLYDDMFEKLTSKDEIVHVKQTFELIYEDDNILIVNKPAGLLVHEDINESRNTLSNQVLTYLDLKGELNKEDGFIPGPVHRLDRNTSGLVIFAKNFLSSQTLSTMIKERHHLEKSYKCIVVGNLSETKTLTGYIKKLNDESRVVFVKKEDPKALKMITKYNSLIATKDYSLLEVTLVTGRTHQIRIHLSSINHPIIGDRKYGDFKVNKLLKERYNLSHQLLHAYKIKFKEMEYPLEYLNDKTFICEEDKMFKNIKKKLLDI